jgi:hypothetical protein
MSKEAMTLALEALMPYRSTITREYTKVDAAIDALRQAISEAEKQEQGEQINSTTSMSLTSQNGANYKQEQEPRCVVIVEVFGKDWRLEYMSLPVGRHKLYAQQYLYTHPQPKQEQGEPVVHESWCASKTQMLTCMPPRRASCNCTPQPAQKPYEILAMQVRPSEFAELIKGKEAVTGIPAYWAEWPNKEKP